MHHYVASITGEDKWYCEFSGSRLKTRLFKLAVLTFKTQQTSSPQYLNQHISLRTSARNTWSSSVPLLRVPFRRTSFAWRSFSTAAPLTWNSLPPAVLNCDSLSTFKSRLETHLLSANYSAYLFHQGHCSHLIALWRCYKFFIIIIIIFFFVCVIN